MAKQRRRAFKQHDGIQSQQEEVIKTIYPHLRFKPQPLPYVAEHNYYPDFLLGVHTEDGKPCYLELKEYMTLKDVPKYQAIMESNPHIRLYFLIYDAPSDVYIRLAAIRGCYVRQGFSSIPQEWLRDIRLNTTPSEQHATDRITNDSVQPRATSYQTLSRFSVSDGDD